MLKLNKKIIAILIIAFLVRLYPLDFPFFTADEARIAFRGYTLSQNGADELGRKFPLIFNSLEDYQLPLTSYITAAGISVFGKNDLGARIMFILIGTGLIYLIYKLSKVFFEKDSLSLIAASIASFSPSLIFFSKFPNEFILSTFLITLLFLLVNKRINILVITLVIFLMFLTSKILWFVLMPVIIVALLTNNQTKYKEKLSLILICALLLAITVSIYVKIPQGVRSITENNLAIVNDVTIKNAIERLRSQDLPNWPRFLDRILFSKVQFLVAGLFHMFYHFQPSILFGNFDNSGKYGFLNMGMFAKILIIPFAIGIVGLLKEKKKLKFIFLNILFLTFPIIFLYPNIKPEYLIISLPLFAIVVASGFINLNLKVMVLIFSIVVIEYLTGFVFLTASIKNASEKRPYWIKDITNETYVLSEQEEVAISDNITSDIIPLLEWYTSSSFDNKFADINFPYRFRQTRLGNIKLIGSSANFYKCGLDKPTYIMASVRDEKEIRRWLNLKPGEQVKKTYNDGLSNEIAFSFEPTICVH